MAITSIENIQSSLANLQENLPSYRQYLTEHFATSLDERQFGNEQEYSPNGLLVELQNLITDLDCLVGNPDYFIRLSTRNERNNIHDWLSQIATHTKNKSNPTSLISSLENLKQHLRPYNLRTDQQRMIAFQTKIDEISKSFEEIAQLLETARREQSLISEISSDTSDKANTIASNEQSISELLEASQSTGNEITSLRDTLTQIASEIKTYQSESSEAKTDAIAHRDEVQEFVEEIQNHQRTIEKQAEQFETFQKILEQNKEEQKQYLEEAMKLIENSRQALEYTTAEGLSASFSAQCNNLTGTRGYKLWSWLLGASISVIGVICIGVWLINGNHHATSGDVTSMWMQIIGKISMIPLLVTATIFCANQYTKQKNLLEDYSYKLTLAKSMIAFSEELREKDPERYREYLSMVLSEIHQDPLRHRVDPNAKKNSSGIEKGMDSVLKVAESFAKLSKDISNP